MRLLEELKNIQLPDWQHNGWRATSPALRHCSGSSAFLQHQCCCVSGKILVAFSLKAFSGTEIKLSSFQPKSKTGNEKTVPLNVSSLIFHLKDHRSTATELLQAGRALIRQLLK